jgi:UrcA family protein
MTRSVLIAAFAAVALISSAASAANSESKANGIVVRYAPEMLDNPADAAKVYGKLEYASRKVCGLVGGFLNMSERTRAHRCVDQTMADLVKKIDRPMLTSIHAANSNNAG